MSVLSMRRYAFPQVDLRELLISVAVGGQVAQELEAEVTVPLEIELEEITGIASYTSETFDNFMTLRVFMADGASLPEVKDDIRAAIARVPVLVSTNSRLIIRELKSENIPALSLGIVSTQGHLLRAREHAVALKELIAMLPDVGTVDEINIPPQEIHILLDRDKLYQSRFSLLEINQAVRAATQAFFISPIPEPAANNATTITAYTKSIYPDDLENAVLRLVPEGTNVREVRLGELGKVVPALAPTLREVHRYNGTPGFGLNVILKGSADIITTVNEVKAVIDEYVADSANADLQLVTVFDGSEETRTRLTTVYENAALGAILVLLVLLIFLSRKVAFWTTVGIGTSLAITFILLNLIGISLNSISLCGIIISLGLIVDGAIVISENIYSFKEAGYPANTAALLGLENMLKPLAIMQLTTMAAFAAIFLIEGSVGAFAREIPIVTISMLAASLLDAIILLPAHLGISSWKTRQPARAAASHAPATAMANGSADGIVYEIEETHSRAEFQRLSFVLKLLLFCQLRLIGVLRAVYLKVLKQLIKRPYLVLGMFLTLAAPAATWLLLNTDFELFPEEQANIIEFEGAVAAAPTIAATSSVVAELEAIIEELPPGVVNNYYAIVGHGAPDKFWLVVQLTAFGNRDMTILAVRDFVFNRVAERELNFATFAHYIDTDGILRYGHPVEVSVIGADDTRRAELVTQLTKDMEELGLKEIRSDLHAFRSDRKVELLSNTIAFAGIDPQALGATLRGAFSGEVVASVRDQDTHTNFRVKLDTDTIVTADPLANILVRDRRGVNVELSELATLSEQTALVSIYHHNGERQNTIYARFDPELTTANSVYKELRTKYSDFATEHPGFELVISGKSEKSYSTLNAVIFSLIAATFFIYLFLVFQFNNFIQPLITVAAIPLSILGALAAFYFHGVKFSVFAMLGLLGASGVVVNVSLVMIEFMNRLMKKQGQQTVKTTTVDFRTTLTQAALSGAGSRFRPIFITTLTTLVGIMPTVYGFINPADSFIYPMTLAMFWGITVGTLASLGMIPLVYWIERDCAKWVVQRLRKKSFH